MQGKVRNTLSLDANTLAIMIRHCDCQWYMIRVCNKAVISYVWSNGIQIAIVLAHA